MTVSVALIGCGSIARRVHLPALRKAGADVVAFCSRTLESAEAAAADWGSGLTFDDYRKALADESIVAVDICSPNAHHCDQTVAAADSGRHVLVEKPIARTVIEANEMIAAARDADVTLHVAHNVRYIPAVVAARDAVTKLGQIVGIRAAFGHSGPRGWAPDSTWFFNAELAGGGALIDLGIHIIDAVRFVTGLEALEVSAMTLGSDAVEDAAQLVVRYEGGTIGTIHASWVARPAPDFALTIFGTEGTLGFDTKTPLTFRPAEGGEEKIKMPKVETNPCADFVRAIEGEEPLGPAATGEDGRAALAIVEAAYQSARKGKIVEVER